MGKRHNISEEELIRLLKDKDPSGIGMLYDNYSAALYGVIKRIVADEALSEDILQESFLKIWNHAGAYNSQKGKLFTWIINIARNLAIDKIRSSSFQKGKRNDELEFHHYKIADSSHNPEYIGLKKLVGQLKSGEREVIEMMFFCGHTQVEVSEQLNLPLGTVKTRARSAIKKLREQFDYING